MKNILTSPKFIAIAIALIAIVAIPLTIIQIQHQQTIKQEASENAISSSQSASVACTPSGFDTIVKFKNTAVAYASTSSGSSTAIAYNVIAKDEQSGISTALGIVNAGQTATAVIHTQRSTFQSGKVTFAIAKVSGSGSATATAVAGYTVSSGNGYGYNSGTGTCIPQVTPTPTPKVYGATPTPPPYHQPTPTPTICPTLGPVKNVHIDCPNCTKQY